MMDDTTITKIMSIIKGLLRYSWSDLDSFTDLTDKEQSIVKDSHNFRLLMAWSHSESEDD